MPSPIVNLRESMVDAKRLLEIHSYIGGTGQGRRWRIDVLNKSAVIFVASAWEAFVEDVATQAIDHILQKADNHSSIPLSIRKAVAKKLEENPNELKVWELAGPGWKTVVAKYRDEIVKHEISNFNTPKPHNVNALFKKLLDIEKISSNWYWQGMSERSAYRKLKGFVETRGAIAHRGNLPQTVTKPYVSGHRNFIGRLSVRTSNVVRAEVHKKIGSFPWKRAKTGSFR